MHTTQFPALYHCIFLSVTVLRPERPQVRILSAAPKKVAVLPYSDLFVLSWFVLVDPLSDNVRCDIGHDRYNRTDKIVHRGASLLCRFILLAVGTGTVLSVFYFAGNFAAATGCCPAALPNV